MTVFRCVRCNRVLTEDLRLIAEFPDRPEPVEQEIAPPTVPRGRYAIDPEPFGMPFIPNEDPRVPVAAFAGMFLARDGVSLKSGGPTDTVVIHPQDAVGLRGHPEVKRLVGCCGPSGMYGRNQMCACGREVATLVADCLMPYELHLDPARIRAAP